MLGYWLTGEAVTDPTIAAKTMLYDSAAGRWAASILDALGISVGLLPPGLPVVAGCGDDHAQALAGGALEPADISVNTGTSSCIRIVTDRFEPRLNGLAECHAYVVPGRWLYCLPMGRTGYFVDWLVEVPCAPEASAFGAVCLPGWGGRVPRYRRRGPAGRASERTL